LYKQIKSSMKYLFNLNDPEVIETLNFNRYAIMAMGMTGQSCLASVAVYEMFKHVPQETLIVPLCILVVFTMCSNALALAQVNMKWYIRSLAISVLISLAILIYVYAFYT